MSSADKTTARIQTPPGRGGIAVIALTGDDAEGLLGEVFQALKSHAAPAGQTAPDEAVQLGRLIGGGGGEVLDEAVVARSAGGAIEINIHAGSAVARAALRRLAEVGAEVVEAGPDAPESFNVAHPRWNNPAIGAEMLQALPAVVSERVLSAVSQQWSAGLSQLARRTLAGRSVGNQSAAQSLRRASQRLGRMMRLLHPPEVVLVGPPNAGKSALTNALVGRQVSIVHDRPGTTRDWVRHLALFKGLGVWLTDTAGLWVVPPAREMARGHGADDSDVEAEAVRRARQRAEQADLVLLISAGEPTPTPDWLHAKLLLRVAAKCDRARPVGPFDAFVSAHAGEGLSELAEAVLNALGLADIDPAEPAAFTTRQAHHLRAAADALEGSDRASGNEALDRLLRG